MLFYVPPELCPTTQAWLQSLFQGFALQIYKSFWERIKKYVGNTTLFINSKSGRVIKNMSKYEYMEGEILFKKGMKIKITNLIKNDKFYRMFLDELTL